MLKKVGKVSGRSSEKTMIRRISRISSPQTEIARVMAGPIYRCERLSLMVLLLPAPVPPPEASAVSRAMVSSLRGISETTRPRLKTSARWQMRSTSSKSEEKQEHGEPLLQGLLQEMIDLRLGADIDADGRLLEHEKAHLRLHPARDDNLLLIAAAEGGDHALRILRPDGEALEDGGAVGEFRLAPDGLHDPFSRRDRIDDRCSRGRPCSRPGFPRPAGWRRIRYACAMASAGSAGSTCRPSSEIWPRRDRGSGRRSPGRWCDGRRRAIPPAPASRRPRPRRRPARPPAATTPSTRKDDAVRGRQQA